MAGYEETLTIDDLRFVIRAVHSVSANWNGIGLSLLVRGRDEIKKRFPNDPLKCLIGVLTNWLQLQYNKEKDPELPSWKKLATVVGENVGGANPQKGKYIGQHYIELWRFNPGEVAAKADASMIVSDHDEESDDTVEALVAEMADLLDQVVARWYEIGVLLGVRVGNLNVIQSDVTLSQKERLYKMLKVWLTGSGDGVEQSWCVLVDAVDHPAGGNNPAEAMKIAEKHPAQRPQHQAQPPLPQPAAMNETRAPVFASNPGAHSTATTAGVSNGRTRSSQTPRITGRPDLLLLYNFPGRQRSFSIAKEVGDKYRKFSVFLLEDGNAAVVKSLAVKCNNDPERINEEILDRWVTGQGGELSWGNMVRVLTTIGLKTLAEEMEEVTGP